MHRAQQTISARMPQHKHRQAQILDAPVYLKALTVDSLSVSDNTINYRYDDDDYYYMYIYIYRY